jgi:hypothetical protein
MTELNIEYAPKTGDDELDTWNDRLVEYLRKYLSQPFDRGDPSSVDFAVGDLTTDETWNDLDCSSVVPEDAIAIIFKVSIRDGAINSTFKIRENGNSNIVNTAGLRTQVANQSISAQWIIPCDTSRVVEYWGTDLTFTSISITIMGWFK